jgi:nucleoside-diphosphate-sugar epimerase
MRVLVIGGTRFIGPRVVRRLIDHGHEVAVFYRGRHESTLPGSVRCFRDPRAGMPVMSIPEELRSYAPEVVLHTISMGEGDAAVARDAFVNVAARMVVLSSGDVYRAYGVFKGLEDGPLEPVPLHETAALRTKLYPYRSETTPSGALEYFYEKVLVERAVSSDARLPATILRLPKVYGPEDNADLWSVYNFQRYPQWRWTHGFVDNVAQAIALAVEDGRAMGRAYNIGEHRTPTVAQRLQDLPARDGHPVDPASGNFAQDIVYDTSAIRTELGFREEADEAEAMRRTTTSAGNVPRTSD